MKTTFDANFLKVKDNKETLYKENYDFIVDIQRNYIERIKLNDKNFKVIIYSKPDTSLQK